jgi:molecular chaperone IbpA
MVTSFAMDLFRDPFFINADQLMSRLAHSTTTDTYPPYNTIRLDEETFLVELAVAGFEKDQIHVTEEDGKLIIEGVKEDVVNESNYVHKGIAARKFVRQFGLDEHMYVDSANMENGILKVVLKYDIPEEKKPKTIKIK